MKIYKNQYTEMSFICEEEASYMIDFFDKESKNLLGNFHFIFKDTRKYISDTYINVDKTLLIYKNNKEFAKVNFYLKSHQLFIHFDLNEKVLMNYKILNFKLAYLKNKIKKNKLLHFVNKKEKEKTYSEFHHLISVLEKEYAILYSNIYKMITNIVHITHETNTDIIGDTNLYLNFDTKDMYKNVNVLKFNELKNKNYESVYDSFFKKNKSMGKKESQFISELLNFIDSDKKYHIIYEYDNFNFPDSVKFLFKNILDNEKSKINYNLLITFFEKEFIDTYKLKPFDETEKLSSYLINMKNENEIYIKEKLQADIDFLDSYLSMIYTIEGPTERIKYYYGLFDDKRLFYEHNKAILSILDSSIKKEFHFGGKFYFKTKDEIIYEHVHKHGSSINLISINLKTNTLSYTEEYKLLKDSNSIQLFMYDSETTDKLFDKLTDYFNNVTELKNKKELKKISFGNLNLLLKEME